MDDWELEPENAIFIAPEVHTEGQYNEKVDCWALGVIAHILYTGQPPFHGENVVEQMKTTDFAFAPNTVANPEA
jgi:serine/threonine protein kinase